MTEVWVEIAGSNEPLAVAEVLGAAEAIGGRPAAREPPTAVARGVTIDLPDTTGPLDLAQRLALARGVYRTIARDRDSALHALALAGRHGQRAEFRPFGRARSGALEGAGLDLVRAWTSAGGRIDLSEPERRFAFASGAEGRLWLGELHGAIDGAGLRARAMPLLPFRRPVSLAPRLARVAVNLARVRPGEAVVDPFAGTGALLAEAGVLGGVLGGADIDPVMLRGALTNLRHLGLDLAVARVGDAGEPFATPSGGRWDAIVTDPPYGRSSSTRGEPADELVPRALARWAGMVRPGGWLALVTPDGRPPDLGPDWVPRGAIPDRVHRSLTRVFRWYVRGPAPPDPPTTAL